MGFSVDPELVLEAQGEAAALDRLITALWPEAYRVALGVLHDRGLAEDAAQDACAAIAAGLPRLRSTEAFYAWMYRIIARTAIVVAKRSKRAAALESPAEPIDRPNFVDGIDILAAIAALPLSQRSAVILYYYSGLTSREIAETLGVPAATVRFHLMLARRSLRSALAVTDSVSQPHLEVRSNVR
jgi:RNA polymerase sigma-70 factor (ECF subfamily)